MKIQQIDLKAFGPFTDRTLTFDSNHPGLHIIFGPNETGKSTALRALKALLYGFPERTSDNFLHPNDQLLVGGCLTDSEGGEISFLRRKRRKTDLFDPDGNPLDSSILAPFLRGMDQEVFETLYGIDHEILVRGGRDILDQKGEVGQTLFSAGAGVSSLREILDALDEEADQLFTPRGYTKAINKAISHYNELKKKVREAILPGRQWKEVEKGLKQTQADLAIVEQHKRETDIERQHIERLKQALPHLSLRRDLMDQIEQLGETAMLPDDFSERRRAAEKDLFSAGQKRAIAAKRLEILYEKKEAISFQQSILDNSETIEKLYQHSGGHAKALQDRPGLEGTRISCLREAAALLKQVPTDLPLEQVSSLLPFLGRRKVIQGLASKHEALTQAKQQLRKRHDTLTHDLEKTETTLAQFPPAQDTTGLTRAVKLATKAGDIDAMLIGKKNELENLKAHCTEELGRLGLWSGELSKTGGLPIALRETIIRFEGEFREYEDQMRGILKEQEKRRDDLARTNTEIREIQYAGDVPTETELGQVRETRERGWQLLRRQWLNGEDVSDERRLYCGELPLFEAYEKQVKRADNTADRLRREADRVYKFATLRANLHVLEHAIEELDEKEKYLQSGFESLSKAWQAIWKPCGIQPLPPTEMLAWLSRFEEIRFKAGEIENIEREVLEREAARQKLRSQLLEELKILGKGCELPGDALTPVLMSCESIIEDSIETNKKRQEWINKNRDLQIELEKTHAEQEAAEEERTIWHDRWRESANLPGSSREILPEEANDILDSLQRCFTKLKEADDLQKRIEGIDRDSENLIKEVSLLVEQTAPELKGVPLEQAVQQLQSLLKQTLEKKTLLEKYTKEIQEAEDETTEADVAIMGAEERISGLRRIAGCGEDDDLDEAERRAREYRQLKIKLDETESLLLRNAGGLGIAELDAQAEGVNPDELPGRIDLLTREIEEDLDPEIKRLSEEIGKKKETLQQMDGNARAAEAAEAGEQVLSRIRRLSDRYIRLKVAATILRQEIERFRSENQDPVLKIASDYFRKLTLGSFGGLRTDEDSQGRPVLVGLRTDNAMIRVEGMSSGTRDQLYLALRLASLEKRLEISEPMPFIVDDILINFDDERSGATLKALADLALKTQVILFTHHGRIIEEADKIGKQGVVQVHQL